MTGAASQMSSLSASALSSTFSGRGLGGNSGYGVGTGYAAAVPAGATYGGPSTGGDAASGSYAQSSPNTATGSLYNKNYASPTFYGKTPSFGGGAIAGVNAAALYPFFLYYPVQYGECKNNTPNTPCSANNSSTNIFSFISMID